MPESKPRASQSIAEPKFEFVVKPEASGATLDIYSYFTGTTKVYWGIGSLINLACDNTCLADMVYTEKIYYNSNTYNCYLTNDLDKLECLTFYNANFEIGCAVQSVTIKNLSNFKWFVAEGMGLTSITMSNLPKMEHISVFSCAINTFDPTPFKATLKYLSVWQCNLSTIDVDGFGLLYWLDVSWNQLSSLDLSGDESLSTVDCRDQTPQLSHDATVELFNSLATVDHAAMLYFTAPVPNTTPEEEAIATGKGWTLSH